MDRDLRKYAKQTNIRLMVGGILLLMIIGGGLIWIFYGRNAAVFGLICLLIGLLPILIIWLFLYILDWFTKKARGDQ